MKKYTPINIEVTRLTNADIVSSSWTTTTYNGSDSNEGELDQ